MNPDTLIIIGGMLLALTQAVLVVLVGILSRRLDKERAAIRRLERLVKGKQARSAAQPQTTAIPIIDPKEYEK